MPQGPAAPPPAAEAPAKKSRRRRGLRALCVGAALVVAAAGARAADPGAPAEFVVTTKVLRPAVKVPPLGANGWGRCGAVEWAANNFVRNAGNEPVYWRNLHRVMACGPNWFEIDGPGTSWWDLWASGFLSGADLRIYRLVDKEGKALPLNESGKYLDISKADHVLFVGKGRILPEGAAGFPDGGWVATRYADVYPNAWIRHGNLSCADAAGIQDGRAYWYVVVAVGPGGEESESSAEATATPKRGLDTPPHILIGRGEDKVPPLKAGADFTLAPEVHGGEAPYRWQAVDENGAPLALPDGLRLDPATGCISGRAKADSPPLRLFLRVTDGKGRSDTRAYAINPVPPEGPAKKKPEPPQGLTAVPGDGCVTLCWKASPSPNVVAYRLKRSTAPASRQESRVYVTPETPELGKFDYVVVGKRFGNFDMRFVNPRVRGIGNPPDTPAWYWNGDAGVAFSFTPHPKPVPAGMVEPGETCLQVRAGPGEHTVSQTVFIGTEHGGESVWYGQLEPGRRYRLDVWLRQEGLGAGGAVTFSYGRGYPDIRRAFQVTGEWKRHACDFTGPDRPRDPWHFGHQFAFTGPGTLWIENARIFRCDRPEDAQALYVPNATVLEELLRSQPAAGPKGAHRIWFLARDATMASILGWYATSCVHPDWRTAVEGTMDMTLPMGLAFDLRTGPDARSRMRPWLVLQHILHTEADWLAFVEYLAAPYDPKTDTPQAKPWAYRRYQQRGTGTPWTDEFAEIVVEFGNETWHNGVFDDWLGFSTRNAVWQGGPEYGFFTRYLVETMKKSPYWKSQGLDTKIRFCLGAGYNGSVEKDGRVVGYGEEAMQTNPWATVLGHANYVGPKWETGDKSGDRFDDHGVQETLLGFLAGPERSQVRMMEAHDALAKAGHDYDITAYEGGPSGYALPGRDSPAQKEANERYGKSLAMAVAALDSWMRSYAYGWTHQCFLGYGQGSYWNSHTPLWDGFRPSPGWQALALRNCFASGDLVAVEERSVPTFERAGKQKETYPLASAYAMRDGDRWSVFLVSRKLDGRHDGADFGDGSISATLRLPFQSAAKITVHRLVGDPRLTNREKLNVAPESRDVPAAALSDGTFVVNEQTGGGKGGLPAGSILLYVFEGAAAK